MVPGEISDCAFCVARGGDIHNRLTIAHVCTRQYIEVRFGSKHDLKQPGDIGVQVVELALGAWKYKGGVGPLGAGTRRCRPVIVDGL